MEFCNHMSASHFSHRKREKTSRKKANARKHEETFHVNGGVGGYGYGYGYPHGYYQYPYGTRARYLHYDEYVAMAPLTFRDGFNQYGCLHFGDSDPYLCYQLFYETPIMSSLQSPPPRQLHPFYTPETVCSIM